jgi:hypothetical protein
MAPAGPKFAALVEINNRQAQNTPAERSIDRVIATTGGTFLAPYAVGFAHKLLDGRVNAAGIRPTVQTWTAFTDRSKGSNYVTMETFVPLR